MTTHSSFTTINCRMLCNTARTPLPVPGQAGCYQLYLAHDLTVDPGQTVPVDVGLLIKTVEGFYPIVTGDQNSLARGLLVNNFNTLVEADSLNKDNAVSKLEFTVVNTGPIRVEMSAGDTIARLVFLQTGVVKLVSCEQFTDEPNFKREPTVDVASMAKTDAVWFKRQYKQDVNKCFTEFFDTPEGREYWTRIEKMRETKEYLNSKDKSVFEAKWVYENMPPNIKTVITDKFNQYKRDAIGENRK